MHSNDTINLNEVQRMFEEAPFVQNLGIQIEEIRSGFCRTSLQLQPHHLQQTGVAHAGVLATFGDHSAGGAASSLLKPGEKVLSAEFKVNFFRGAQGPALECHSRVLKRGRTLIVCESEIFDPKYTDELIAKLTVTLSVIHPRT